MTWVRHRELAACLASPGRAVGAVGFADSAMARASEEHAAGERVRWLRLDIERDDPALLDDSGHGLITLRLTYPFVRPGSCRSWAGCERLREGGALVIITSGAEHPAGAAWHRTG
ncbi:MULTISPECIES: hypothetical protein [unclassified Streptomyces]|uniref:hypothetical protein n=1 Tax=unclassified Streptomyces TaxID=2593676 RepID=UPI0022B6C8D5|nr:MULTISPECIES: hypothetical protein [unclassified Streptomyces]MCZ7412946.1 hypothetical protein [Streptomyces sp. WMMC897]MCZ7434742.1 hypothetical protein [Streptomyces sp. WMMC1477]